MNPPSVTDSCVFGLSGETLSAWRDGVLPEAMMERVGAHVTQCAACQSWLASFDVIGRTLRNQRLPEPSPRLWMDVQSAIERHHQRRFTPPPRVWSGLGALAAALIVVALFAQMLGNMRNSGAGASTKHPTATASNSSTATPSSTGPLTWQPVTPPTSLPPSVSGGIALAVAPSLGEMAYACYTGIPPRVYVTNDHGGSWSQTSSPGAATAGCSLTADSVQSSLFMLSTYQLPAQSQGSYTSFVSSTSGGSWRVQPDPADVRYISLATTPSVTYALRVLQGNRTLEVSSDHLQTWTPIDGAITQAGDVVQAFWANASNGNLLAETFTTADNSVHHLWASSDSGAHWSELHTPAFSKAVVQAPHSDSPWRICVAAYSGVKGSIPVMTDLQCSANGGQGWAQKPVLHVSHAIPQNVSTAAAPESIFAIAGNGALLAVDGDIPVHGAANVKLYSLGASAGSWSTIGHIPQPYLQYATAGDHGVLWATSDGGSSIDTWSHVYTAEYQLG